MDRYTPKCKFRTESSSTCEENEISNTHYDNAYSDSASFSDSVPSKDNVDLSLDFEIDESSKHIIIKPKRRNSTLVDVNVIKTAVANSSAENEGRRSVHQHGNENRRKLLEECKHKLKGKREEIPKRSKYVNQHAKKDIGVMSTPINPNNNKHELSNRKFVGPAREGEVISYSIGAVQPHYINGAKEAKEDAVGDQNSTRRKKKKRETHISSNDAKSNELYTSQDNDVPLTDDTTRQVYATIKTFSHLRRAFPCQHPNKNTSNKPDMPCLCEHCGVVGLLVESQKRPMVYNSDEEDVVESPDNNYDRNPASKDCKPSISSATPAIIKELNERVRLLEIRIQRHEAKAVSKDYFKKVINKIVSYLQPRYDQVLHFDQVQNTPHKRNISTQCSKAVLKRDLLMNKYYGDQYCVRTVLTDDNVNKGHFSKTISDKKPEHAEDPAESSSSHMQCFWKWGEEVVKPGIDLKDKMVALLEEKLSNFKSVSQKRPTMDIQISCVESDKTLFLRGSDTKVPSKERKSTIAKTQVSTGDQDASQFKNILDAMSTKIYEDYIQDKISNPVTPDPNARYSRNSRNLIRRDVNDRYRKQNAQIQNTNARRQVIGQRGLEPVPYGQKTKSGIPVRRSISPKGEPKKSMIPKLQKNCEKTVHKSINDAERIKAQKDTFYCDINKSNLRKYKNTCEDNRVQVTYVNPKVSSWLEESYTCLKEAEVNQKPDSVSVLLQEKEQNVEDSSKCVIC